MHEELLFVHRHRDHIRVKKAVYNSMKSAEFPPFLILLVKLLPSNTTRSLSSDAYMNENPEKGLEIMYGIVENSILMTMEVLLI